MKPQLTVTLHEFGYEMDLRYSTNEELQRLLRPVRILIGALDKRTSGRAAGGYARARALSPERRSEISRNAAKARWHGRQA